MEMWGRWEVHRRGSMVLLRHTITGNVCRMTRWQFEEARRA